MKRRQPLNRFRRMLIVSGVLSFTLAVFQIIIGFSPSMSLYFGAPEALARDVYALIFASFFVAGILVVFGLYALSGAGYIRPLPWLKQVLLAISGVFLLRGLLIIPEFLAVIGVVKTSMPSAPRFMVLSIGSLLMGFFFLTGTIGGWKSFPSKN